MEKPLQWHPAFQAVLQIEFAEEAEHLQFLKEYNLTDSPLRIDTLIVKMEAGVRLRKKIGRIFRRYNIIEYKGPKDSHTVNSFFKVNSYAGLLQSGTRREREIPPEEITITLVGNHYPRKLIAFLKTRYGVRVENPYPGIFYIEGLLFPIQVLVQRKLEQGENLWLNCLRQDLDGTKDVEALARAYKGKDKDPLHSAAMDLIVRANRKVYEEGMRMCDALNELFADKLELQRMEGITEGKTEGKAEGKAEDILMFLEEMGSVPSSLREKILAQQDLNLLSRWLKLAAKAENLQEFERRIL